MSSARPAIADLLSTCAFNEWHILAITQAICDYRKLQKIDGPLFLGMDTHALSEPAFASALEVLAANNVEVMLSEGTPYTPTPAVSHAILRYNRGRKTGLADGIVITPSHNPPDDGGFKYDPPHGGPADSHVTSWIESKANEFLRGDARGRQANALRASASSLDDTSTTTTCTPMSTISKASSTWRRFAMPRLRSESTRSAARASIIGR